jgi:hypothetical protein
LQASLIMHMEKSGRPIDLDTAWVCVQSLKLWLRKLNWMRVKLLDRDPSSEIEFPLLLLQMTCTLWMS